MNSKYFHVTNLFLGKKFKFGQTFMPKDAKKKKKVETPSIEWFIKL